MSIYPSLEDMKVDQLGKAQNEAIISSSQQKTTVPYPVAYTSMPLPSEGSTQAVYPSLGDYMGLEITESVLAANMPEYTQLALYESKQVALGGSNSMLVAPLSGQSLGLQRAQVTNGIRQLVLCKDKDNKIGIRVRAINNGIFVCLVVENSPAAMSGLRFGDQILEINGASVAGCTMDKVHNMLRKSPVNGITVVVRDRPFERTLTLHKDSTGHIGFQFKNGKIVSIVKDSSAARNGVLTEHQLLEVEGRNVVGMKDKETTKLIEKGGEIITITVIPSFIYEHMIKKMAGSMLKGLMDHSLPDL